jgi:hypothetical protein
MSGSILQGEEIEEEFDVKSAKTEQEKLKAPTHRRLVRFLRE